MRVPISNLDQVGEVDETPDHILPPNAWTKARNVTFRDGHVQKARGFTVVDDSGMLCAPQFLMPYYDPVNGTLHWIYPGTEDANNKGIIASYDGTTHANRTDTTAYPGTAFFGDTVRWNGAVVNGVAVVNNKLTTPQVWGRTGSSLDADFKDLTDWQNSFTTYGTCSVIRGFRNFFIALDTNDTGTTPQRNPYEVKHSGIVDAWTPPEWLPSTTNRAGSKYIGEGGGFLVDCLPMRDVLMIYSENECWPMTFVGGNEVFAIGEKALLEYGMLAEGCAAAFGAGHHFLVSVGDIVVHDGNSAESIVNSRVRDSLFSDIDETNYTNCFVVNHYAEGEMWFCYPSSGNTYPNKVARWNIKSGAWSFQDLGVQIAAIRPGAVPQATSDGTWDSDSGTWDSDSTVWDEGNYNPTIRSLMMAKHGADAAASGLYEADNGNTLDGTSMVVTLQRTGLTVAGVGSNGIISDPNIEKFLDEVWPRIQGGPVDIRVGTSQTVDGTYTWTAAQSFDPLTDRKLDFRVNDGYYLAIEFSSNADVHWTLDGYDLNVKPAGAGR